ncbi:MAG: hypothetical protein JW384_02499 [Nitrosomonadaceae bacterium]|nr:hypothetical protein [Nitrosomonadaceae bacterium]
MESLQSKESGPGNGDLPDYRHIFDQPTQDLVEHCQEFYDLIPRIRSIIDQAAGVELDWDSEESLKALGEEQLLKVRDAALIDCNEIIREVMTPIVRRVLKGVFGEEARYPVRVSAQVKKKWTPDELAKDERLDSNYANFAFPTRAHQDLVNNGCRSSHTLILYYQLTPPFHGAANMEVADTRNHQVGLWATTETYGYVNELKASEQNRLDWHVPDYTTGNIYYMTGMKPHRTGRVSDIPRIALNVKVQPLNLEYLKWVYGADLELLKRVNQRKRYSILRDLLEELMTRNNGLNFELGVLKALTGEENAARDCIKKLFVSESPSEEEVSRLLYGGFLRKVITAGNPIDYKAVTLKENSVAEFSCAHAIMETIG